MYINDCYGFISIERGLAERCLRESRVKLTFYKPTGPLSGVTMLAIAAWLVAWLAAHRRWREKTLALARVTGVSLSLLALGLLLTFPPFEDLLLRK